ncbi:MAG: SDR family NAD(P)-dependent oxidoreductase [Rhizobiaceae bacterium]|nr:SDR family NAD(P)-dependent oxidoreductase [Rhizobiaceae bacterium]MCV0406956.1 SDR family NAD(P)-dependent oxidoreductase [Rhizobiaceae bacterium]
MRTAVITGGAGGLGRALTAALLERGWQVAVLDLAGAELEAAARERVAIYPCDVTDPDAVAAVCAEVEADHPSIDLVIYNAGVSQIGLFAETSLAAHRRVIEINHFGAVHVAAALLGAVRKSRGTHLAVSSVAGFAPLHRRAAYAASKHAMEGFFKTLATEEAEHGVHVSIAAPSFLATNIGRPGTDGDGIARPGSATDGIDYMEPDEAARVMLDGVEKRRAFIPVGRVARLSWLINRFSPALYARLMMRSIRQKGEA